MIAKKTFCDKKNSSSVNTLLNFFCSFDHELGSVFTHSGKWQQSCDFT